VPEQNLLDKLTGSVEENPIVLLETYVNYLKHGPRETSSSGEDEALSIGDAPSTEGGEGGGDRESDNPVHRVTKSRKAIKD